MIWESKMDQKPVLAIIGGSGLYDFPALENVERIEIDTPYGKPSAPVLQGMLEGKKVAFLWPAMLLDIFTIQVK